MGRSDGGTQIPPRDSVFKFLPTRDGFLWKANFWTDFSHPAGYRCGGYTKWFRAWTRFGAMRMAERHRHQSWAFDVWRSG